MSEPRCDSPHCEAAPVTSPTSHYDNVRDAVTKGPVQFMTEVAALHTFGEDPIDDRKTKNLTHIAEPAARCRLKVNDGEWLPAASGDEQGYRLYITYNHLMFAPKLRLECHFTDPTDSDAAPYHIVALEFPFSSGHGKALQHYHKTTGLHPHITFSAEGATSTGLGNIQRSRFHLQRPERVILKFLRELQSTTPAQIELELDLSTMLLANRLELMEIDKRLPGGSGPLLQSFSRPEYSALDDKAAFSMSEEFLKRPYDLMNSETPFPMVPLSPLESFSSQKQAAIYLGYSAYHGELEARSSVRAWAQSTHKAAVFHLEHYDVPILAVRFAKDFVRLGGPREVMKFKLPREMQTKATFKGDLNNEHDKELLLVLDEISGLPPHDAAFIVLNNGGFAQLREMDKRIHKIDDPFPDFQDINFDPKVRSSTLDAMLVTSNKLLDRSSQWLPHLLNQDTSQLEEVDLTRHIDSAKVREADDWLFTWKDWNDEQRQLLQCIHRAKGSMVIAKGVAGTGKSTLQSAIALYFARLGFKVFVTPPANSNASQTALEINAMSGPVTYECEQALAADASSEDDSALLTPSSSSSNEGEEALVYDASADETAELGMMEFRGISTPRATAPTTRRLFASSLSLTLEEMLRKDTPAQTNAASNDPSTFSPLSFILQTLKDRKTGGRDFSVEQSVIDEAEKGLFKLYGKTEFGDIKPENDVWDLFRKHLKAAREGTFSWTDRSLSFEFAKTHELCKGHVIAATDILVTTTGNARSPDILQHWLRSQEEYGIPSKGVVVLCDEAFKDGELSTWNAIMAPGKQTKGVFMFGDDFQLKPTNTTSSGKLVFGQFNDQLDIALPSRLVKHGFPYVYLKKQQRMHPCLSKFPNEEFYAGELRDGVRVDIALETVMPGLADVLHGIILNSYSTFDSGLSADHYRDNKTDEKARHHYIEVDGTRRCGEDGTSKYVQEHIDVFFKYIFPPLQAYWGSSTSKNLMIICAYTAAKVRYRAGIERLQLEQELPASFYPSIEELVPESDAASSRSSESGTATPASAGTKKRNPETAYSRYLTIDAAQGQESFMVLGDFSMQDRDDVGFMVDRGRCNVAMTRAKGVFWMIGGAMGCRRRHNIHKPLSPFPKLKQQMGRVGRVHRIKL